MTDPSFIPQPYPLFATTAEKAEEPTRLEPTLSPVHLVLGWMVQDGTPRPVLDGSPDVKVWTGAITYHESRAQAEATAKDLEKMARSEVRRHDIANTAKKITGRASG